MTTRAIEASGDRQLLARILESPNLARVVPRLAPELLHRIIRVCGLEDSAEIVALATPEQLMRVFDLDVWRSDSVNLEAAFDADRFGLWLEVLAETGIASAARMFAAMDFDFVTAAMSQFVLVEDQATAALAQQMLAQELKDAGLDDEADLKAPNSGVSYGIGGYTVIARRNDSWDALLSLLVALDADHHDVFARLMHRCCHISTEQIEDNGSLFEVLTAGEQVLSDVTFGRERRREGQGYVTPSLAVAFLESSRRLRIERKTAPDWDHATLTYFREVEQRAQAGDRDGSSRTTATPEEQRQTEATERDVASFVATLREAGVVQQPPGSRLLEGDVALEGEVGRLTRIREHLQFVQDHDVAIHARRMEELGYLTNVLISGCSFESRRFTASEASDGAFAVCNLGLENWPPHWSRDSLVTQDLVTVFRVGWSVLHDQVCSFAARRLADVLSVLTSDDEMLQDQFTELARRLRRELRAGMPWRTRDSLDVIAILDLPSWSVLQRLLDECPRVPKALDRPGGHRAPTVTSDFAFISENSQVAWAHDFIESLPERLVG